MLRKFLRKFLSIFTITTIFISGCGKVFAQPGDDEKLEDIDTTSGEIQWSEFCLGRLQEEDKLQNGFEKINPRESFNPKRLIKYYDSENKWVDSQVIDEQVEYDKILKTLQNIETQALNREVSLNELSNISEKDKIKVAQGIYEWVVKNINYYDGTTSEFGEEIDGAKDSDQDAIATFYSKKGVCEGITNLTVMLAKLAGIKAVDITSLRDSGGISHAFPAIYLDDDESKGRKGWVIFDPTWAISSFNYFRLNCFNMNCDDFLKIFDINQNCNWDNGLNFKCDQNIKWDFKILNSLKYVFKAYNFEHKNIFSGSDEYFNELIYGDDEDVSLKEILNVISLNSDNKDIVEYLGRYGVKIEELKKNNVFDIKHINNKINEAIDNYLSKLNIKYEKLEMEGYNKSTPKISNFRIVKNTFNDDHLTRSIYVNYNLDLKHISTKKFFLKLAQKNMNMSNKGCKIEFNDEFQNFIQGELVGNFPACYSKELSFKDSNLKLLKAGGHTIRYIGPCFVKYFLEEEKYFNFFANIANHEGNSRLSIKPSLSGDILKWVEYLGDNMKEYMNNEKKTKKKNMLRKKRKAPDYYEELFKKEAKRCCMNHLMKNNEMGYNTLCSFFENGRNGIVLKSDNNFDIPFLFTKRCFEFSDVFPDELGLIKLEGNWKIDFFGSDLKILKKLDFTNCNTYEKEGGCIYEKAENGTKKLVFEF